MASAEPPERARELDELDSTRELDERDGAACVRELDDRDGVDWTRELEVCGGVDGGREVVGLEPLGRVSSTGCRTTGDGGRAVAGACAEGSAADGRIEIGRRSSAPLPGIALVVGLL